MSDHHTYPAGAVIVFTRGEYSDFTTCGHVRALVSLDLPELAQKFAAETKDEDGDYDLYDFIPWLVRTGAVEAADTHEVHLGAYSSFEPEFGVKGRWA